mmetsp:Transcript_102879/g.286515  ORF Transcript_102879/g.286515 Transcript_102879/m.286515 type:complete len:251 (+) Transcript_102879:214-966(+)
MLSTHLPHLPEAHTQLEKSLRCEARTVTLCHPELVHCLCLGLVRPRLQLCELGNQLFADARHSSPPPTLLSVLWDRLPALPELRAIPTRAIRHAPEATLALVPCLQALRVSIPRSVLILHLNLNASSSKTFLGSRHQRRGNALALHLHIHDEEAPMTAALLRPRHPEGGAHAAHSRAIVERDVDDAVCAAAGVAHGHALPDLVAVHALVAVGPVDHGRQPLHQLWLLYGHGRGAHLDGHEWPWPLWVFHG